MKHENNSKKIITAKVINYTDNESRVKIVAKIIFWGFISAVFFNFIYQGAILNKPYPYNTFLFLPLDRFNDFFNMVVWCKNNNPYFDHFYLGNSNYLPFANLIFWFFSFLPKKCNYPAAFGGDNILMK